VTRVVVVADAASVRADLTAAVAEIDGAVIVRSGTTRAQLDKLVAGVAPDLVVIGDLHVSADALARLAEIRSAAPAAKVVILSSSAEAGWLAAALRAHAAAVLPGNLEPRTLAVVLREVLAESPVAAASAHAHGARSAVRQLRDQRIEASEHEGAAA
jgi:DNA-binding NarL/FixJ family response regulator